MNIIAMAAAVIFSCSGIDALETGSLDAAAPLDLEQAGQLMATAGAENVAGWALLKMATAGVEFEWTGRGFMCHKDGISCKGRVKIGIGDFLIDSAPPGFSVPDGATPAVLISYNDVEPTAGAPSFSERTFESYSVFKGELPFGTTVYVPEQPTDFDDDNQVYWFYVILQ